VSLALSDDVRAQRVVAAAVEEQRMMAERCAMRVRLEGQHVMLVAAEPEQRVLLLLLLLLLLV
jgi:hypothetical protein